MIQENVSACGFVLVRILSVNYLRLRLYSSLCVAAPRRYHSRAPVDSATDYFLVRTNLSQRSLGFGLWTVVKSSRTRSSVCRLRFRTDSMYASCSMAIPSAVLSIWIPRQCFATVKFFMWKWLLSYSGLVTTYSEQRPVSGFRLYSTASVRTAPYPAYSSLTKILWSILITFW